MKKLFEKANLSFMIALQMLVLPAIICLVVSIFIIGNEMNSTYNDAEGLYYDTLYQINNKLVNADRDFYQAMLAAQQYMSVAMSDGSLPQEEMDRLFKERTEVYNENLEQTLERVNGSNEIAATIPYLYTGIQIDGKTYKDYSEEFQSKYDQWLGTYDFKTQEGDITAFNDLFEQTRDGISGMTDVVEQWA
ncbi:MAG: hypothetical protein IK139_06605, partial [Lachnospiraceae bacterium]|nr:hypothetical protein [Lachnospiraceae bacterium]